MTVLTLVTPLERKQCTLSKPKLFGFLPAEMCDGATVFAAGAVNPLTQGNHIQAIPSPSWKGWTHAKNRR